MTEPSQYFKGRTVQEQMDEVISYVDQRSAEVATAAIASDVAQVHQDMLDADADASAAAASAAAAAGTLANAVKKTGESSQTVEGDITMSTGDLGVAGDVGVGGDLAVTGTATVQAPVNNTDAATKKYVDDQDALKVSITDINQYAVGLTGNQNNVSGIKTFVSSIINITTGTPEVRFFDDAQMSNLIAGVGVRYRTATTTNAALRSYAPKVNPANPSEVQRGGFLQLVSNQDGTMTLNIYATKADGSLASKTIATFNGTNWS